VEYDPIDSSINRIAFIGNYLPRKCSFEISINYLQHKIRRKRGVKAPSVLSQEWILNISPPEKIGVHGGDSDSNLRTLDLGVHPFCQLIF